MRPGLMRIGNEHPRRRPTRVARLGDSSPRNLVARYRDGLLIPGDSIAIPTPLERKGKPTHSGTMR